jgi:predicted dehydrogenase/acetyltransferase-like isoleucine patch superfamily enzyme
MSEEMQMGVAVIGSGYWGKNLVRNYQRLGALKVICDKDETTLASFKKQYSEVEVCLAFNEVLRREDIQGIVIATPAETHFALAREAMLAGKHVYVEKPLVLDEKEAEELISLAQERKLTLMVGHLLQYHPAFLKLKELASKGELGRINYICSHRLNLGKIRREENILWSFAPHDISMILSLAGEEPEIVSATGGKYLHQKIADVTTTHFEFPSGLKAHIFVSWLHPFKEQKLVVVGDRKMAVFDDTKPWDEKLLLYSHQINWENNVPVPAKAEPEHLDIPEEEPLLLECGHFLRCIATGQTPRTDGHEGLRVLRILNASQRSLDENGKRICLTEIAGRQAAVSMEELSATSYESKAKAKGAFVHPTAIVDENVTIETGTKIWHFSHILPGSRIGANCNIGQNVVVGPNVTIGNQCKIQNNVSVYKGVTLEDGVFCGPSMVFTNVYNPRAEIRKMDEVRQTLVKKGATIGANATIVCGVTIGRYAFIGAGAVINKNVLDHALVVGNPGKEIGWACECGENPHFWSILVIARSKATWQSCGLSMCYEIASLRSQ